MKAPPAARTKAAAARLAALALALLLPLAAGPAAAGDDRGLIWRIGEGPDASYLVGSVHVGTAAMYPLPEGIRRAWQATETLVLEADPREFQGGALGDLALSRGLYQDGRTLRGAMGEERWSTVADAAAELGVPAPVLLPQRPWMAFALLTVAAAHREGFQESLGLEAQLVRKAGERPVIELEGAESQLAMLSGLDAEVQQALLTRLARQVVSGRPLVEPLVDAWRHGDAGAMLALLEREFPPELDGAREVLMDRRNRAMAERIGGLLADGRRHFVLLGAAHMVGDNGLVERLRRRGYTVEQL